VNVLQHIAMISFFVYIFLLHFDLSYKWTGKTGSLTHSKGNKGRKKRNISSRKRQCAKKTRYCCLLIKTPNGQQTAKKKPQRGNSFH